MSQDWSQYIGRSREEEIVITSDRIMGLAALLDYSQPPWPANQVPPTGHWLTMFAFTRQSRLGHDGHEMLGDFIPAIDYPRRMWVGGRIRYSKPLSVDQPVLHRTTIKNIENKTGKSGAMTFVTLMHEYLVDGELLLEEDQDIVYRDALQGPASRSDDESGSSKTENPYDWSKNMVPDSTLLFRYSAVTFNAHKIHYDHEYVKKEGYPGLLVHAPLTVTLLIDLYQSANPVEKIKTLDYRAHSPLYADNPLVLYGKKQEAGNVLLWAEDTCGKQAVIAKVNNL